MYTNEAHNESLQRTRDKRFLFFMPWLFPAPLTSGVERVENDFRTVSNLKSFASSDKKSNLIKNYIIPLVKKYVSLQLEPGAANAVGRIINMTLDYKIETNEVDRLKETLRGVK